MWSCELLLLADREHACDHAERVAELPGRDGQGEEGPLQGRDETDPPAHITAQ